MFVPICRKKQLWRCLAANRNGITPAYMGELPEQLAPLNRSNTYVLTIEEAMMTKMAKYYIRQRCAGSA
ncbi:hypothetical protein AS888_16980 [Peribacillus simplex]|uniref:Uncharacterized protein n=1 Tax=Peribacillus simplex TaxID=1478 RepID=A0A125QSC7_9BACI|nr:hypothetical protein [Peribacillus simplex]KWW21287.1 hypothetical protein AS888_16980 [Peribacillus simplex]